MKREPDAVPQPPVLGLGIIRFSVIQTKINSMHNKKAQKRAQTLLDTAHKEKQQIDHYLQGPQPEEFHTDIRACIDTINTAKAALSACRLPSGKDKARVTYILRQMTAFRDLKHNLLSRGKAKEMQLGWEWRGQGLRVDQQRIKRDEAFYKTFQTTLASIGDLAREQRGEQTLPSVFLSYAWRTEKNKLTENWVQPFLVELKKALQQVGFTVVLDIRDVAIGGDAQAYMRKVVDCDYTLLFCTPSLKEKCDDTRFHAIKIEMAKMILKYNEDILFYGEGRILPLVLEGINGENYPDWFHLNKIVFDFRKSSYVENLKFLLRQMLELDLSSAAFQEKWLPIQSSPYTARLTEEAYQEAIAIPSSKKSTDDMMLSSVRSKKALYDASIFSNDNKGVSRNSFTLFPGLTSESSVSGTSTDTKVKIWLYDLGYAVGSIHLKSGVFLHDFPKEILESAEEQLKMLGEKYCTLCSLLGVPKPELSPADLTSYNSILKSHMETQVTLRYPEETDLIQLGMECFNFEVSSNKKDFREQINREISRCLRNLGIDEPKIEKMFSVLSRVKGGHRDVRKIILDTILGKPLLREEEVPGSVILSV